MTAQAVRQIGVTQQTFYRWRKLYGRMQRSQLVRLKELEKENQRLRRAVSDLTLDKLILTETAKGKLLSSSRRRKCIDHVRQALGVLERRACRRMPDLVSHKFAKQRMSPPEFVGRLPRHRSVF
ncbi:transposase [Cognatishimia sp. F0-27]|nr:transposase [Cognatishimia sp. F0-27]